MRLPRVKKTPILLPVFHVWILIKSVFRGNYKNEIAAIKEHNYVAKKLKLEEKENNLKNNANG